MSATGSFDRTKHFDELNVPLRTAEGLLSSATRKQRARLNLGIPPAGAGTEVTADDDRINVDPNAIIAVPQTHIMKRILGDSSAPVKEANIAGQGAANAAIISGLDRIYDAGPYNAVYDMGHVVFNVFGTQPIGIEGNGSQIFNAPANIFTNTNPSVISGATAAMFEAAGIITGQLTPGVAVTYGTSKTKINGIKIHWHGEEDNSASAIYVVFLNEFECVDVEVDNMVLGTAISINSIRKRLNLRGFHIHDFYSNSTLNAAEQRAVELDAARAHNGTLYVSGTNNGFIGGGFHIRDLLQGAAYVALHDRQCDGITLHKGPDGIIVADGFISGVAEGVDCQSNNTNLHDLIVKTCNLGVKFVHGARNSKLVNSTIHDCDQAGVYIGPSGDNADPTYGIKVLGCDIQRINMLSSGLSSGCVWIDNDSAVDGKASEIDIAGNLLQPIGGARSILNQGYGSGIRIWPSNREVISGAGIPYTDFHTATDSFGMVNGRTAVNFVKAYINGDLLNVTGDGTTYTLAGWTEVTDRDGIFDPSTGVATTKLANQTHRVGFKFTGMDFGSTATSALLIINMGAEHHTHYLPIVNGTLSGYFEATAFLAAGAAISFQVQVTNLAKVVDVKGAAGGFFYTEITIEAV